MKKIIRNIDKPLLIISIILFIIGLVMIFSASNITSFMKYSASPYNFFFKQLIFLTISVAMGIVILFFHSKSYKMISRCILLGIIGLLFLLIISGTLKNNARSWFNLGFMSIQPSEFAKVAIIVYLAGCYNSSKNKLDNWLEVFRPLVFPFLIALLIFMQPDLGTTIIFSSIVACIFFLTPMSKEIKSKILGLIGLAGILMACVFSFNNTSFMSEEQKERFDFKEPCSSEKFYGKGNQVCNSYIAINNGGLKGVGLGDSTQKYLYLPEAHTDFIFAIIMEELGFLGSLAIFLLYFLLISRIIRIGKKSYNLRGYLICMGVSFYIMFHIIVNLGGVFGIMPMTGVPLPFMSYGGSFAMCLVIALSFVQRINIENNMFEEKKLKKSK